MIEHVVPKVKQLCTGEADDEEKIIAYLQRTTMVGVLPVPHPILIRKYHQNDGTNAWFHTFVFGCLFIRNSSPPIFYGTKVQLFQVNVSLSQATVA